jgi:type IV pilus assembly protein PilM
MKNMKQFLKTRKSLPMGIEIADQAVKAVQVTQSGKSISINAYSRKPMPASVLDNGDIKDFELLEKTIRDAISNPDFGRLDGKEANISLPESKTFLKVLSVEKTSNPIADSLRAEMEKHLPISVDDVYYDWQIISENEQATEILLAAVPKTTADAYLGLLRKAGLDIIAFEPEAVATCRALIERESGWHQAEGDESFGIIDIGSAHSSFSVYSGQSIKMNLSIDVSNQALNDIISKALDINGDQAEKAKLICGLDTSVAQGIVAQILDEPAQSISSKIQKAVDYYASHFPDAKALQGLFLCGSGAHTKKINEYIGRQTGINCMLANAYVHLGGIDSENAKAFKVSKELKATFTGDRSVSTEYDSGLDYVTAIGLALRSAFIDESE